MKQKNPYRLTLAACYTGYITQAVVVNLAPLLFIVFRDEYRLSYEMLGRLIVFNFGTQIVMDVLAMKYVDRIGYRRAAVLAHALCAVGLVCLGALPAALPSPYVGLMIAAVVYAAGGGIIEVLISPIVNSLPGEAKASSMSLLHSFYCWGQVGVVLVTTLLLGALGMKRWFLLPVLWAVIPAANIALFAKAPLIPPVPDGERTPILRLLRSKAFALALVMMLCAGAAEITMSQWSSLFAQKALGVPKIAGDLAGPCLFAALMGLGRMLYGMRGGALRLRSALAGGAALCVVCYLAAVFSNVPAAALAGCALCGLGVSLMWPGTLSLTAEAYPLGGTAMFGALAVFGDIGASAGPWLAGLVSELAGKPGGLAAAWGMDPDQLGLKAGLLVGTAFPLLLLVALLFLREKKIRRVKP
jgi:fucose permease